MFTAKYTAKMNIKSNKLYKVDESLTAQTLAGADNFPHVNPQSRPTRFIAA